MLCIYIPNCVHDFYCRIVKLVYTLELHCLKMHFDVISILSNESTEKVILASLRNAYYTMLENQLIVNK